MGRSNEGLGAAPLAALFTQTATAWTAEVAPAERWHGLAVYGLDGTTLRVPDTPANVTAFGRPPSPDGAGAGYPHVRLVTLLSLRHHLLAAAAMGAPRTGELALARAVWAALPDHAVVILDRGFCSYALFHALSDPTRDRHWLVRAGDGQKGHLSRDPCAQGAAPEEHLPDQEDGGEARVRTYRNPRKSRVL